VVRVSGVPLRTVVPPSSPRGARAVALLFALSVAATEWVPCLRGVLRVAVAWMFDRREPGASSPSASTFASNHDVMHHVEMELMVPLHDVPRAAGLLLAPNCAWAPFAHFVSLRTMLPDALHGSPAMGREPRLCMGFFLYTRPWTPSRTRSDAPVLPSPSMHASVRPRSRVALEQAAWADPSGRLAPL
jgi:hypothetical protein